MGVNVSKASTELTSKVLTELSNKGCSANISQGLELNAPVTVENVNCKNIKMFNSEALYDAQCTFDTSIETIKKTALENKAQAKALLGLSAAVSDQKILEEIDQRVKNECGNVSIEQDYKVNYPVVYKDNTCENLEAFNKIGSAKAVCVLNAISKLQSDTTASTGASSDQGLDSSTLIGIVVVVVVILIIIIIVMV